MTCQIGDELDNATSVITAAIGEESAPRVLDMGMAPGGFTSTVLKTHPSATLRGISLPPETGGLRVMLPNWQMDERVQIEFLDITMLADELGTPATSIPVTHKDLANFSSHRPFLGEEFDIVFCGAAVQRTQPRAAYRDSRERLRLTTSQLVLALQRIREGGSLVVLLHKVEAWDNIELINNFIRFSKMRLFKPQRKHAVRSSFYLVATNVRARNADAISAVSSWRTQWDTATFGTDIALKNCLSMPEGRVHSILAEFGLQFIRLADPVWKVQAIGLRVAPFLKKGGVRRAGENGTPPSKFVVVKDYEPRGKLTLHRLSSSTPITCGRCKKEKTSKLVATYDGGWDNLRYRTGHSKRERANTGKEAIEWKADMERYEKARM